MAYRCWTHVALAVGQLQQAEEFYARLFGLAVTFRETETADGWRTLRGGAGWDSAHAAGIEPQLSSLRRNGVVLALEATEDGRNGSRLSHLGIAVDEPDLDELRCAPGNSAAASSPTETTFSSSTTHTVSAGR